MSSCGSLDHSCGLETRRRHSRGRERRRVTPMASLRGGQGLSFGHVQLLIFDPVCSIGLNSKAVERLGSVAFCIMRPAATVSGVHRHHGTRRHGIRHRRRELRYHALLRRGRHHGMPQPAVLPLGGQHSRRYHALLRHGNHLRRLWRLTCHCCWRVLSMGRRHVHDRPQNHFRRYTFHHQKS